MDIAEYRKRGKEMVDYIADYLENIRSYPVYPQVRPGYMKSLLPDSAPEEGQSFSDIMKDFEKFIMPGLTHWQSPHMHAYFPALNCPASLLGDMLADGINCLGFTWASSPACTELEIIVTDWLGKMLGLPKEFLHSTPNCNGGGVIQTTSSEATLVALLAARTTAFRRLAKKYEKMDDVEINERLVAYTSDQAHSSVEKAGLIGLVKMRYIESDTNYCLRGDKVLEAIAKDKKKGLIPFFLCATLGTTGACAFDNLKEIVQVCATESIWVHVDAAYAGTAFICPEFRRWLDGIEQADSFAFNPSKWMMVHFDCTAMWVKDSAALHRTFNVNPIYLKHENTGVAVDYMHWQIPLSRRFRALKLWFVIRNYGIKGLQDHVRNCVQMAQYFEKLILRDNRLEIPAERHLGMVIFRIKGNNEKTEELLKALNQTGLLHCVPASLHGKYVIRFTVTSHYTTFEDLDKDWRVLQKCISMTLPQISKKPIVTLSEARKRSPFFGTSLLLCNTPMVPKVIDGSYVAIVQGSRDICNVSIFEDVSKNSPVHKSRLRSLMASSSQLSLDSHLDLMKATNNKIHDSQGNRKEECNGKLPDTNGSVKTPFKKPEAEENEATKHNQYARKF